MWWEAPVLNLLHLLLAVIWVGGMFFAWAILRPATAKELVGLQRARLWHATLKRFLIVVAFAVIGLPATGYRSGYLLFGGLAGFPAYVMVMQIVGWAMIVLYLYIVIGPWRRLGRAIDAGEPDAAGQALGRIRRTVGFNLLLGFVVITVASVGQRFGF